MPMYDYTCRECGHEFQTVERMSEHEKKKTHKCPKCDSKKVERVFAGAFVQTSKKS